jgi:uncharacterized protein
MTRDTCFPSVKINYVSTTSIEEAKIEKGIDKPVSIKINMTNSAGIYQVGEILHKKLVSGIAGKYIEITAQTIPELPSTDERIIYKITVEKYKFVHSR